MNYEYHMRMDWVDGGTSDQHGHVMSRDRCLSSLSLPFAIGTILQTTSPFVNLTYYT
jgi:hypothetical protein